MANYSGTTSVQARTTVRRQRLLPQTGEVTVNAGQRISPEQIVARSVAPSHYEVVQASEILGVSADKVAQYMQVDEGAAIHQGMLLFEKPGRLGRSRRFVSPIDGVLQRRQFGTLLLQQKPELTELRAMISGQVDSIVRNRGVIVETVGSLLQGVWGSGPDSHGRLVVLTSDASEALAANNIRLRASGSIIVGGRLESTEALNMAVENGARGIITGSIPANLVEAVQSANIAIVVTDGIGRRAMSTPHFLLLQDLQDKTGSLLTGSDRLTGLRPEIIVPDLTGIKVESAVEGRPALSNGKMVRILRGPHVGTTGRVKQLLAQGQRGVLSSVTPGANVELDSGEVVFAPYANLDILLE